MHNNDNLKSSIIDDYNHSIKIILVGESSVGKTNICKRYCYNEYTDNSISTISVDVLIKIIEINNEKIKANIWDTLGQEKFSGLSLQYYRSTVGALFIFDLSNKNSFDKIDKWYENYKNYGDNTDIIKFLIGNKSDLKTDRHVKRIDAEDKAKALLFDGYYEISAKTNENINEMFQKFFECKI